MKAAIIYDRVNKWGGAERVLLTLHEIFPDAPLYTSIYSPEKANWAKVFPKVVPTFLQIIPFLNKHHELLGWLTPIAYESFSFDEYDLVITVTSEAAKGIITKPSTSHICICLTPTRYLWSGYKEYLENPPKSLRWIPFYKTISRPFLSYARYWDKIAGQRPDVMIAISKEVRERIKKYYHRESKIIYPPVDIEKFINKSLSPLVVGTKGTVIVKRSNHKFNTKNYYLIVSRLEPYKKVDLAVDAFNELGYPLMIVGVGSDEVRLKAMANRNIIFQGFVDDKVLPEFYQNAKGFVFPQIEDFGITAVESQAAGVPVIAFKKGGALDTVIDGTTGVFFKVQSKESLISAVKKFEKMKFDKKTLQNNAMRFGKENFKKEILDLVKKTV